MGLFVQHFCALKEFIARERWSFSAQVFRQPRHEGKNSNTSTVTEYNVVEKSLSFQNARVRNGTAQFHQRFWMSWYHLWLCFGTINDFSLMLNYFNPKIDMPRFINGNAKYLQCLCSLYQVSSTLNLECQGSSIFMQNCNNGYVKYCQ